MGFPKKNNGAELPAIEKLQSLVPAGESAQQARETLLSRAARKQGYRATLLSSAQSDAGGIERRKNLG